MALIKDLIALLKYLWSIQVIRYVVALIIGVSIALVIVVIMSYIVGIISQICSVKPLRLIIFSALSAGINYFSVGIKFSSVIAIVFSVFLYLISIKIEIKTETLLKSGNFVCADNKFENSVFRWGSSTVNGIFVPLLINIPSLVCSQQGISKMNWFLFYWKYDNGIWSYIILRFIMLGCILFIPFCAFIFAISEDKLEAVTKDTSLMPDINDDFKTRKISLKKE